MEAHYTAVITGDIVGSRQLKVEQWLEVLKAVLVFYGKEPNDWEIIRGDMFQLEVSANTALSAVIHIKAAIKQIRSLDVRMGIGIGNKSYVGPKVSQSNGEAFIFSGNCYDGLNKNKLALASPWSEFDTEMNLYLKLASLTMDNWATKTAEILKYAIEYPNENQTQLAKRLNRTQSTISESLKRAAYEELTLLNSRYIDLLNRQFQ